MTIKVSVLMPIYKTKEAYLRTAIESILNQTFTNFEFLILDDCPNDTRENIVKSYKDSRIKYIQNPKNMGITQSRNKLIEMAQGEYLATMDHDDISLPTRFAKQVAYLDGHKDVGVVGCLAETFPKHLDLCHPEKDEEIKAALTSRCAILHPASMIRKSVLIENKIRYEERYTPAEDYHLWLQLMDYTNFYNIQEVLFRYRHHEKNTTHKQLEKMTYTGEELRYLARKKHPELFYKFLSHFEKHRIAYIFKKIPLLSFIKKNQKITYYLFDKIPFYSFVSSKNFFTKLPKCTKLKSTFDEKESLNGFEEDFEAFRVISEIFSYREKSESTEVWFCHTLGGGSEAYFREQIESKRNSILYIEIQDFNTKDTLKISYFYKSYSDSFISNYKNTEFFINQISPQKIVVNNLACYFSLEKVLNLIKRLKQNLNCFVSFRGHDFQAICPNIHMKNSKDEYCNCSNFKGCESCIKRIKKPLMKVKSISKYKNLWQNFLYNVVDEVILFSQSTFGIYKKFYPLLENKIKITPHIIKPFDKVKLEKHSEINIGILGNLTVEKSLNIIIEIDNLISNYSNTNCIVIGSAKKKLENIRILGRYEREKLPEIMKRNKIDIVFISSIIPETFSYTTAEAISMELPIACFNLGAQAEFIKNYSKGLIINKIDAKYALEQMIHFVEKERNIK